MSDVTTILPPEGNDMSSDLLVTAEQAEDARLQALADSIPVEGQATPTPAAAGQGDVLRAPDPSDRVVPLPGDTMGQIGVFLSELPRTVAGGVRDAGQEALESFNDLWNSLVDFESQAPGALSGMGQFAPVLELAAQVTGPAEAPQLPEVAQPSTVGGQFARKVTQFLAGFVPVVKAVKGVGVTNRFVQASMAGAIVDGVAFDPHEQRLSNLIQEFPALQNPVSEFLAAKPGDSKALGRFKNAVEGLGLGVLTDGFVASVRAIAAARRARGVTKPVDLPGRPAPLNEETLKPLGKIDGPLTTAVDAKEFKTRMKLARAKGETAETPPGVLLETGGDRGIFINMARISSPDDVKNVLQQTADLHSLSINKAQRGKQSFELTEKLADDLQMTPEDLIARNRGQPFNAETALAARNLMVASGEKVLEMAKRAADPNAGQVDAYNFRRTMAVHHAIQKEVLGARTETARALNAWKIPAGGSAEKTRAIQNMLDSFGGQGNSIKLAKKLADADAAGILTPAMVSGIARKGALGKTRDALLEAWIMGLLSGPKTHIVNMMSNTSVVMNAMLERSLAGRLGEFIGTEDGVVVGESLAMMHGILEGWKDLFRFTAKKARGEEVKLLAPGLDLEKIDVNVQKAISSEALGLNADTLLGKTVDGFGAAIRVPGAALRAEDAVFKTLGYRMELHAQAFRMAKGEGLTGKAFKERMWAIINNPPESVRLEAVDTALYQTFTKRLGDIGQTGSRLANMIPGARIVLPFIRTPANIFKYTFERTPLAPLMSETRANFAAGGARAQLAATRMAMGTAVMLTVSDLVMNGMIVGGPPPNLAERESRRAQNIPNYAMKIGDTWVQFNRADPIGGTMGMAADVTQFIMWAGRESEDTTETGELIAAGVTAIGSNVLNKNYLRGVSEVFNVMGDPQRNTGRFLKNLAGSLVPAGVAEITRLQDPHLKAVQDMTDGFWARTPGFSKDLPNIRDRWGREVQFRSGVGALFDAMSPIYARRENPSAIDKELERLDFAMQKPGKRTTFNGVTVDLDHFPFAYDRFVELQGNALKHPAFGMGQKDYLDKLVSGKVPDSIIYKQATDGPDGTKAEMIRSISRSYRELAKQQVLSEKEDLDRHVTERRNAQMRAAIGGAQ